MEPVAQPIKTIVVKPHTATDESQLELEVNEIVYVLEKDETGWWGGHKEDEDTTGWFPGTNVRVLPEAELPMGSGTCLQEQQTTATPTTTTATTTQSISGGFVTAVGTVQEDSPGEAVVQMEVAHSAAAVSGWASAHDEPVEPTKEPTQEVEQDGEAKEKEVCSPSHRRISLVASPQRGPRESEISQKAGSMLLPGTPVANLVASEAEVGAHVEASNVEMNDVEALRLENDRLKSACSELSTFLSNARRESDVERNRLALEMRTVVQQADEVERKVQSENAEKAKLLAEAETLRKQLAELPLEVEKERRSSQVMREECETMLESHRLMIQEQGEELRGVQESGRKSMMSEKKLKEELDARMEEIELAKSRPCEPVVGSTEEVLPRRLFPSGSYDAVVPAESSQQDHSRVGNGHVARQLFDPSNRASGSPSGNPLPEAARGLPSSAASLSARPPEPPRALVSDPRQRSAVASTNRFRHAASTGNLAVYRSASSDPPDHAPPSGCVRDKVQHYEKRAASQTPRRVPSTGPLRRGIQSDPRDGRAGRASREERPFHIPSPPAKTAMSSSQASPKMGPAASPPVMPTGLPTLLAQQSVRTADPSLPRGFQCILGEDAASVVEQDLDLGMSPLHRDQPKETLTIANRGSPPAVPPVSDFSSVASRGAQGQFSRAAMPSIAASAVDAPMRAAQTTSPEPSESQLSVRQRINQFQTGR